MALRRAEFSSPADWHSRLFNSILSLLLAMFVRIPVIMYRALPAPALHELPFASIYVIIWIDYMGRSKGTKAKKKNEAHETGQTKKGYGAEVSIPVCLLVDNWEATLIANNLSTGSQEQP